MKSLRNFVLVLAACVVLHAQGIMPVHGTTGSGTTDNLFPVKIGGVFNTVQPTVTNQQRVDLQATARGALIVATGADTFTVSTSATVDNTTTSTALGALNDTIAVALNGQRGANFELLAGGTGVYTVTPKCNFAGTATFVSTDASGYIQDSVTGVVTLTAVIASGQALTNYPVMCPQGASHAKMVVTAFTSGTANWIARSTTATWPGVSWGVVTAAAPTYAAGLINALSLTTAGALRTDGSGVTQPVSGTVTANQGGTWTVQPGNTQNTTAWLTVESRPATGTETNVAASATSVNLLASNTARRGAMIFNDSTTNLRVKLGATASATSFTAFLGPSGFWAIPFPVYTGAIDGIWDSATGNARVTETQ